MMCSFFDFHVFPKYRGRAMDWFLMTHILHSLAAEGQGSCVWGSRRMEQGVSCLLLQ